MQKFPHREACLHILHDHSHTKESAFQVTSLLIITCRCCLMQRYAEVAVLAFGGGESRGWGVGGDTGGWGSAHIWIHQHAGPAWRAPHAPSLALPASLQQGAACGAAPACSPAPGGVQATTALLLARTRRHKTQQALTRNTTHHCFQLWQE